MSCRLNTPRPISSLSSLLQLSSEYMWLTGMLSAVWHQRQRWLCEGRYLTERFFSVYVCVCVRMGLCNELETWVRLKWLVISPGRWGPGAAWIKWLPGWLTNTISHNLRQTEMGWTREGWRNGSGPWAEWTAGWGCGGGAHGGVGTQKEIEDNPGMTGMQGMCCPKKKRGIERVLLSFMKKYRETEVTWQGWKRGGEYGEWKERSQASLVSICSRRSHPYLWPHCRWQQHG